MDKLTVSLTLHPSQDPRLMSGKELKLRLWDRGMTARLLGEPLLKYEQDGVLQVYYLRDKVIAQEGHHEFITKRRVLIEAKRLRREDALRFIFSEHFELDPYHLGLDRPTLFARARTAWLRLRRLDPGDPRNQQMRIDEFRAAVALLRHQRCYEDATADVEWLGSLSDDDYARINARIALAIVQAYPFLASECVYQLRTRGVGEDLIAPIQAAACQRRRCSAPSAAQPIPPHAVATSASA